MSSVTGSILSSAASTNIGSSFWSTAVSGTKVPPYKVYSFLINRGWTPVEKDHIWSKEGYPYDKLTWGEALAIECMEVFLVMEE
jgi:hypothetical protein